MEKYGGQPLNTSETEPLEQEMYFALEKPLIEEILQSHRENYPDIPFAMSYVRPTIEGDVEMVGMLILDRKVNNNGGLHRSYDVTLFHHKDGGEHALEKKDSLAYVITEMNEGVQCLADAMYADGMNRPKHRMNAVEHSMLIDELLAVRSWQLADADEHDILAK